MASRSNKSSASLSGNPTSKKVVPWLSVALVFLLVAALSGIGGTFAALTSDQKHEDMAGYLKASLVNTGDTTINLPSTPGTSSARTAIAQNDGTEKMYVKMKIEKYWCEKDANDEWQKITDAETLKGLDTELIKVSLANTSTSWEEGANKWIEDGGWYYYMNVVKPGEQTSTLLTSVSLSSELGDSYNDNIYHGESAYGNYYGKAAQVLVTLEAVSKPVEQCTVTFDTLGGNEIASQTVIKGNKATKPANPTRTDATFAGWYTDDAWTKPFDFSTPITDDITIYAGWDFTPDPDDPTKDTNHTVRFVTGEGTSVASQSVKHGGLATKPSPDPTRSGYTFGGWYSDQECTEWFDFASPITSSTAVFAKWIAGPSVTTHTVKFDTHGGTTVAERVVEDGKITPRPTTDPTKEGKVFAGWYSDENCTQEWTFGEAITSDMTIHAKWVDTEAEAKNTEHTVVFEDSEGNVFDTQKVEHGKSPVQPADPTKSDGSVFGGWYADIDCTESFDFDSAVTSSTVIYAKWYDANTTVWKVDFNTNGGSTEASRIVVDGQTTSRPTNDPTKDGKIFAGWYKDSACTQPENFTDAIKSNKTIYAKWADTEAEVKNVTHGVTFNTNGGTPQPQAQSIKHGESATKPSTEPTKSGYTFGGWYADASLKTPYDFGGAVTSETVIYAKWYDGTVTTHTVTFNTRGGSTIAERVVLDGTYIKRPTDPTRDGYEFAGWYSDAACTNGYDFADPITADMTIYAKWINLNPIMHTVSFETNGGSAIESQLVQNGKTSTRPDDPVRDGYTFDGWYTDDTYTTLFDFDEAVFSDETAYAKWTKIDDTPEPTPASDDSVTVSSSGNNATSNTLAQTGDNTISPAVLALFALCALSFVVCLICLILAKRRDNDDDDSSVVLV